VVEVGAPEDHDRARRLVGRKLDGIGGGVGRIERLLVDAPDGSPTWLVVRLGRFGRRTAIPVDLVASGASGRAWVALRRGLIRAAPQVGGQRELSPEDERSLAAHYGIPPGRMREAADGLGESGSVAAG